jgi:hypothetical protein
MRAGDDLIQLLEESSPNQWLVIHGHKHYPKLQYARGTSGDAPVILSAGSTAAVAYPIYGPDGRNQVHLIEIDVDEAARLGLFQVDGNPRTGLEGCPISAALGTGAPHAKMPT